MVSWLSPTRMPATCRREIRSGSSGAIQSWRRGAHGSSRRRVRSHSRGDAAAHAWGEHDHPSLTSPDKATPGNGLLLFFRVDDFDSALERARKLVTALDEEPHINPSTNTMEFSLRDPDGYYVHISAL